MCEREKEKEEVGVGKRWIMFIKGSLESTTISVFVNGSLIEEFFTIKNLRYGDPMTSFLLWLMGKALVG